MSYVNENSRSRPDFRLTDSMMWSGTHFLALSSINHKGKPYPWPSPLVVISYNLGYRHHQLHLAGGVCFCLHIPSQLWDSPWLEYQSYTRPRTNDCGQRVECSDWFKSIRLLWNNNEYNYMNITNHIIIMITYESKEGVNSVPVEVQQDEHN